MMPCRVDHHTTLHSWRMVHLAAVSDPAHSLTRLFCVLRGCLSRFLGWFPHALGFHRRVQRNGITLLDAIMTYGKDLTVRVTPVEFGRSRHTITDNWIKMRREIVW